MPQVLNFDEVEMILVPYQIRPLTGSNKPLLIHLPTALGGSIVAGLISMLIRY